VPRSNRSADSYRDAPLAAASSRVPSGDNAAPVGPWKPVAAFETPNSSPTGATLNPAGVTGAPSWRLASAVALRTQQYGSFMGSL
jgi:hypothetical protein